MLTNVCFEGKNGHGAVADVISANDPKRTMSLGGQGRGRASSTTRSTAPQTQGSLDSTFENLLGSCRVRLRSCELECPHYQGKDADGRLPPGALVAARQTRANQPDEFIQLLHERPPHRHRLSCDLCYEGGGGTGGSRVVTLECRQITAYQRLKSFSFRSDKSLISSIALVQSIQESSVDEIVLGVEVEIERAVREPGGFHHLDDSYRLKAFLA